MPVNKKTFDPMGDDMVELSTENDSLEKMIGSEKEKRLEQSEAKPLKQFDDEKRANLNITTTYVRKTEEAMNKNLFLYLLEKFSCLKFTAIFLPDIELGGKS